MRISNISWGLCATVLVASAAQADRVGQPVGVLDDSPSFMLYVHKQIGAPRHKGSRISGGPSFGFAIERPTPAWAQTDSLSPRPATMRLLDLRFAPYDGGGSLFLNGMQLTGQMPEGLGYESYGGPNRYWWYGGAALAALLIGLCATDNDPCGGDDDDTTRSTTETPGT